MKKKDEKRPRMVVEEVSDTPPSDEKPKEEESTEPIEEIKEASRDVKEKAEEIEELANEVAPASTDSSSPPPPSENSDVEVKKSAGVNALVIIVPGIFLLGGLLGGIFFYQNKISSSPTPAPTEAVTTTTNSVTPTGTPSSKEVDVTKYKISVLNGSGTAGEAGKVQKLLEDAGYIVSNTGNAPTYDFTKTVIQAKSDVDKDFITKLSETLSDSYSVDSKTASLSDSSSDEPVVVVVGSTKAN